jgi:hypothetical protein
MSACTYRTNGSFVARGCSSLFPLLISQDSMSAMDSQCR